MVKYKPTKREGGAGVARVQRKFQILSRLYERMTLEAQMNLPGEEAGWMTTGLIARECAMTTSPHFRALLDELLGQGAIQVKAVDWRTNMQAYVWRINDNTRWSSEWKAAFDALLDPEEVLQS